MEGKEFSDLSVTFKSCNINSLRELFEKYPGQIACVITEPEKNICGNGCNCNTGVEQFLKEAIELTHQHGALFIIDEMITGFKTGFPGTISKYNRVTLKLPACQHHLVASDLFQKQCS